MSKKINLNINFSQNNGDKQVFYTDYNLMADIPETFGQDITVHSESTFKGSVKELKNTFIHFEKYIYSIIKDEAGSENKEDSDNLQFSERNTGSGLGSEESSIKTYESIQEKIKNLMKSQCMSNSESETYYPTGA